LEERAFYEKRVLADAMPQCGDAGAGGDTL
jgi:hypothetical protein